MMRRKSTQWILLAIAAAIYLYMPVWTVVHQLTSNDFKHIYLGMKALLDGSSPYPIQSLHHQAALQGYQQIALNPFVYLPFTGYAMAFLAPFSLATATLVWFVINHILALATVFLLSARIPRWRIGSAALMILFLAVNVPFYITLSAGQLNMALLFLVTLACHWMESRPRWAGAVLGFVALFKLMPGLFGLYLLLRRKWTALISMVLTGLLLFVASTSAAGLAITREFLTVLSQMGYGKSTWPWANSFWDDPSNQSLNSFFSHLLTINDHTTPWMQAGQATANLLTVMVTLLLTGIWITLTVRRTPSPLAGSFTAADRAAYDSTLILALLIPSLLWDHYLVMLLLPITGMVHSAIQQRRYFALGTILICALVTSIRWDFAAMPWRSGAGIFLMSMKLWPTLILFGLSLCFIRWNQETTLRS